MKLTINDDFRNSVVSHSDDLSSSSQLRLRDALLLLILHFATISELEILSFSAYLPMERRPLK